MTIATIEVSPVSGSTCIIQKDFACSETWDTFRLLRDAGFSGYRVGCWSGYENCIVFDKDKSSFYTNPFGESK